MQGVSNFNVLTCYLMVSVSDTKPGTSRTTYKRLDVSCGVPGECEQSCADDADCAVFQYNWQTQECQFLKTPLIGWTQGGGGYRVYHKRGCGECKLALAPGKRLSTGVTVLGTPPLPILECPFGQESRDLTCSGGKLTLKSGTWEDTDCLWDRSLFSEVDKLNIQLHYDTFGITDYATARYRSFGTGSLTDCIAYCLGESDCWGANFDSMSGDCVGLGAFVTSTNSSERHVLVEIQPLFL